MPLKTVLIFSLLCRCLVGNAESPQETAPLFRGVKYLPIIQDFPRPLRMHLVSIHLGTKGIRFLVTPPPPSKIRSFTEVVAKKTTSFARSFRLQLAINGGFYSAKSKFFQEGETCRINGLAVHNGKTYSNKGRSADIIIRAFKNRLSLWVQPGEAPWSFQNGDGQMALGMPRSAQLLREGKILPKKSDQYHPRSAIGTSKEGQFAFLLIVDGRQPGFSEGVSKRELSNILLEFGAYNAINLDGGGSSTLVIQQADASYRIMNHPSDFYPFSLERAVGTHLGVFAERLDSDNQ